MTKGSREVFNDYLADLSDAPVIVGTNRYFVSGYSSLEHSCFLRDSHQIVIEATGTSVVSLKPVPVTISIQHSSDGQRWFTKSVLLSAEFFDGLPGTRTGGEKGPRTPNLRYVRLEIQAGSHSMPFSIQLSVRATTRSQSTGKRAAWLRSPLPPPINPEMAKGIGPGTIREVSAQLEMAQSAAQHYHPNQIFARLSPEAQVEMVNATRRLADLPPATRLALARTGRALDTLMRSLPVPFDDGQE